MRRAGVVARTLVAALAATAAMLCAPGSAAAASSSSASPSRASPSSVSPVAWAPAARAPVHPAVRTYTAGAQCTANFVFADDAGVYLGQAAHCSGGGEPGGVDGCSSGSLPLGTPVRIDGATRPGTLAYSSWIAMRGVRETRPDVCAYNDFALVRIDPHDVAKVNPSVPFWGGPTGVDTDGTRRGEPVVSYGNSSLRNALPTLSPKKGVSLGDEGQGWSHAVFTVTPGIPGDSGSPVLSLGGAALGVVATLRLAPVFGSNGVGDLAREVAYARAHGIPGLRLVKGTVAFRGPRW